MINRRTKRWCVGWRFCSNARSLTALNSFLFSFRTQMGHPQRQNSSWEDGTGAASGGTISLGSCRSTLEWRNKKVSGRLLGTLIYPNLPGSPPPVRSTEISFLQLSCQGTSTPLEWLRSNAKLRSFCLDGSSLVPVRGLRATPFSPLFNLCTLVRTATK